MTANQLGKLEIGLGGLKLCEINRIKALSDGVRLSRQERYLLFEGTECNIKLAWRNNTAVKDPLK